MIGTSFVELVLIRASIIFFRYPAALYTAGLLIFSLIHGRQAWSTTPTRVLLGLLAAEAVYTLFVWMPFTKRLLRPALHPPPQPREERRALFDRCLGHTPAVDTYLRGWFLGAELEDIRRDNLKEFLLWAFFDHEATEHSPDGPPEVQQELEEYIHLVETRLGYRLKDGRGSARSLRLTFDKVWVAYRGLSWYIVILIVDQITHAALAWHGYRYYARSPSNIVATFPPRPQELLWPRRSPAPTVGYWYYPHSDKTKVPVVFFHGIGVGLLTYIQFLAGITRSSRKPEAKIGVIAIEVLPVSFRLTSPPPTKTEFLAQMARIIDYHGWDSYAIASHSYGSVLTTHMLHSPQLGPKVASVVLIDPVTISLHQPSVAYNFTRRMPRRANEWQLWYFASTDPSVALCLGRNFFWRDNIIWKEDLLGTAGNERRIAVCLAGRDLIVDTQAVTEYLGKQDRLEVFVFPRLDHAQVFDDALLRNQVVQLVKAHCSKEPN